MSISTPKKSFPLVDATEPNLLEDTFDYSMPPLIKFDFRSIKFCVPIRMLVLHAFQSPLASLEAQPEIEELVVPKKNVVPSEINGQ